MSEPQIDVVADPAAAANRAARLIAEALRSAVDERGRADWATTGGSAPTGIYLAMLEPGLRDAIPWLEVHTWWGDDRFVPSDHPLSNVRSFMNILLEAGGWESVHSGSERGRVRIPVDNIHPFQTGAAIGTGRSAAWCADELVGELNAAGLPELDGWPVFDLILLGLGGDGHILSVFPGSASFDSPTWAQPIPAPTHIEPHVERVTLNPAVVRVARRVLVVATGAGKAEVVSRILGSAADPRLLPGSAADPRLLPGLLARRDGATWVLDEAAAADLPR